MTTENDTIEPSPKRMKVERGDVDWHAKRLDLRLKKIELMEEHAICTHDLPMTLKSILNFFKITVDIKLHYQMKSKKPLFLFLVILQIVCVPKLKR